MPLWAKSVLRQSAVLRLEALNVGDALRGGKWGWIFLPYMADISPGTNRAGTLTAKVTKRGSYMHGAGLMLVVWKASAFWMLRWIFSGKRRDMGLGPARRPAAISLADARLRAGEVHAPIMAGH
jgi:hypothetical protein